MKSSGRRIGASAELAAGVQFGEHDLERRDLALLVPVDGDAPAVVVDLHRSVAVQYHLYPVAVAGRRFVDRVVDQLPQKVHETVAARSADVHPGSLPDRLEAFEGLDRVGVVGRAVAGSVVPARAAAHRAPLTIGSCRLRGSAGRSQS